MIYERDMPLAQMEKQVRAGYVCGDCGGRLNVAWGGAFGYAGYILRCGRDPAHNTITKHRKKSEYEQMLEREYREVQGMDSKSLMAMDPKAMEKRMESVKWPQQLTPVLKQELADHGAQLRLRPDPW